MSVAKAADAAPAIDGSVPVHTVTPKRRRARRDAPPPVDPDPASVAAAAAELHARGVEHVWVRRGVHGSLLSVARPGRPARVVLVAAPPTTVEDVTGAGDAMTAGYVHAPPRRRRRRRGRALRPGRRRPHLRLPGHRPARPHPGARRRPPDPRRTAHRGALRMTTTPHPMLSLAPRSARPSPPAARSSRSSPRSSATGCPTGERRDGPRGRAGSSATGERSRRPSPSSPARPTVGLSDDELEMFGADGGIRKVSVRDIPHVVATGVHGATTVASTMRIAALAGIRTFVTGGPRRGPPGGRDLDGRLRRPHRALAHRGRGHLRRRQVDPRHRPHPRGPRDPRCARRRPRHRRLPLLLLARQRPARADAGSTPPSRSPS